MRAHRFCFVLFVLAFAMLFAQPVSAKQEPVKNPPAVQPVAQPAATTHERIPQDQLPKKVRLQGSAYIPFKAFDRKRPIMGGGFLLLPPDLIVGKDKVPVVIILHGSGGVNPDHEYVYARELVKMGVAAFVVDGFTPRGIVATHEDQDKLATRDYLQDAFTALYTLRAEPRVDTKRAGILGFSKGAIIGYMAALKTKRKELNVKNNISFKAHYLFYPGCVLHYNNNATTGAPITMFLGEKDTYTGAAPCTTLADELNAKGAKVKTNIYKNATHAWDFPGEASHPKAEVFKDCRFDQQANGMWNEKKSGVKNIPALEGELYNKALKGCLSYGVVRRENADANAQSMEDLKALVKEQLLK